MTRRMHNSPYRHAAAAYYDAGWRGILPLPSRRKTPPPDGFTGANGVWPSVADMQAWKDGPEGDGNICLRVPQHVLGIDVDHYGDKHGGDTFTDAEAEYGPLPPTWTTTSRYDGVSGIRLYRVPEGLRWPGELGPDTELIQHRHRYAVVWPSIHPDGRQYTWIDPDGERTTTPPHVDQLPALPEPWIIALTGGAAETNTPRNTLPAVAAVQWLRAAPSSENPCSRTVAALQRSQADLSAGSRHAAARDATLRLVRLAADGHHGAYWAVQQFAQSFLAACDDAGRGAVRTAGVAEHEFLSMLTGAVNLITADPANTPPDADPCINPFSGLIPATTTPATTASGAVAEPAAAAGSTPITDALLAQEIANQRIRRAARKYLDAEEAAAVFREPVWRPDLVSELAIPDEPVMYTVDEVMPTGANVLLTAQFKAGKTTLVNHLTRCLVDKEPFLGHYDVQATGGRVALFNYEVDERQYRRWLREVDIANADKVTVLNLRGYRLPLTTRRIEDWIVAWLRDHNITVWIVDPFARAFVGAGDNENDNTQVGAFLDALDVIKHRAGVSDLVMPTHTGRAEFEEGKERARGATRLDDWADVRWLLTTDESGSRFFRASGRDVEVDESRLDYYGSARRLLLNVGTGRGQQRENRIAGVMLAVVEQTPGIGYKGLRDAVREHLGSSVAGNAAMDAVRERLLRDGRMLYVSPKTNGAQGKHYPADASDLVTGGE